MIDNLNLFKLGLCAPRKILHTIENFSFQLQNIKLSLNIKNSHFLN